MSWISTWFYSKIVGLGTRPEKLVTPGSSKMKVFSSSKFHGSTVVFGGMIGLLCVIIGTAAGTMPVVRAGKSGNEDNVPCFCLSFACEGSLVSQRNRERHHAADARYILQSIQEVAVSQIIQFCLRGMLSVIQRRTLFNFYGVISELFAQVHNKKDLPGLTDRVNVALALLERDFPLHLQNITTHMLRHIAESLYRFGPVYSSWMYPFERFNSWVHRRAALNRAHPEATVMETYALYDWCVFMMVSGQAEQPATSREPSQMTRFQRFLSADRPSSTRSHPTDSRVLTQEEARIAKTEYSSKYALPHAAIKFTHEITTHDRIEIICSLTKRPVQYMCSSIVHVLMDDSPIFGRVHTLFTHYFTGSNKWARVAWLPEPICDDETQIWYTLPDPVFETSIPLDQLSIPHVTAIDEGKLWILSQYKYPQRRCYFDDSHLCLS